MKKILMLPAVLALGALAGCPGKPPEPQAQPKPDAHATADVSTPWNGMKQDEQRARDVQKTVDAQARKQRQAIDAASQ